MGNILASLANKPHQHPVLGSIYINQTQDAHGNTYEQMTTTVFINSKKQFDHWNGQMKKIDSKIGKQVLLLPNRATFSDQLCGSNGLVNLAFDLYPFTLSNQIDFRKAKGRYFIESQLWYLLYTLVRAGFQFQKEHNKIGDIHPKNIVINSKGLAKLVCKWSLPHQLTNFDKFLLNPRQAVYLAPQQLTNNSIKKGQYPKDIDPSACECYSIGLCMLAAGNLDQLESLYNWDQSNMTISLHLVQLQLGKFREKYNQSLYEIVAGLLADDSSKRNTCSHIYSALLKHQKNIINLQPFSLNNPSTRSHDYAIRQVAPLTTDSHTFPMYHHYDLTPIYSKANATNIYYYPQNQMKSSPKTQEQSIFRAESKRVSFSNRRQA